MINNVNLSVGQPLRIRSVSSNDRSFYVSRIVALSQHTITISLPYDAGRMILWPVGTRLEVDIQQEAVTFTSEIIDRALTVNKSYTILSPHSISKTAHREQQA